MKLKWITMTAAAAIIFSAQCAHAGGLAVGVKASTLGAGVELTTNVVPLLMNLRLQVNDLNYNRSINTTQVTYNGKLKLFSVGAIADFYPFAGKFRVSGGLYYNGNKFDITGRPSAANTFVFNGVSYTGTQVGNVNGTINFNKIAPYVGIGWGDAISSGSPLGFSFEVGALYQGKARTSITTSRTVAGLNANIAAEKKRLDNSLNNFRFYPVVALGLNWRF